MALILALLMLTLAAAVATEFLYNVRVDLQAASNARQRQQARYAAKAGVEAGTTFIRIDRFNDWAAVIQQLGVPGFGVGGFVKLVNESQDDIETRRKERAEALSRGEKGPSMGTAANPYDPPNGYLSFVSSTTGFNFFDDDNIDVEIRFYDEAGKFNVNALVYWMPAGGGKPAFNMRLYRQISQLVMDQTVPVEGEGSGTIAQLRRKFKNKGSIHFRNESGESRDEDSLADAPAPDDVGRIMCAILDWLDPDDDTGGSSSGSYNCDGGAERDYYTQLDEPYEPRNGPLESIGELRLVRGMTPQIFRRIAPFLTVYTRTDYTSPPQGGNNCTSAVYAPESVPNDAPAMPCFSPDVNLHTAPDPVIEAFFAGGCQGQNPGFGDCTNDFNRMTSVEARENLLTAINCFRGPGTAADRMLEAVSKMQNADVGQKGAAVELGKGAKGELEGPDPNKYDCPKSSGGGGQAYLFAQETLKGVLANANLPYTADELMTITNRFTLGLSVQPPPSPQKFDTITSRWVTIEAVGLMGVATDMEPVESRVSATVFVPPVANPQDPPTVEILRWDQD